MLTQNEEDLLKSVNEALNETDYSKHPELIAARDLFLKIKKRLEDKRDNG